MRYPSHHFDLDGVICRTDQYHYLAWKQVADELGIPFDEQVNERLRGVSRMASFDIILERYDGTMSDEEKIHWTDKKNEIYKSMLTQMGPDDMLEGVADTLHKLRAMGLDLAIGSSSRNTKFILGQLGLSDFFDAISDGTNITRSKPDPEVFVKAAEFLNRALRSVWWLRTPKPVCKPRLPEVWTPPHSARSPYVPGLAHGTWNGSPI